MANWKIYQYFIDYTYNVFEEENDFDGNRRK